MSETFNVDLELRDKAALAAACSRLGLSVASGVHNLYRDKGLQGLGVSLQGWRFPAIVKADGTVAYDNYHGRWGDIKELNKLKAYYGLEKAKIEARKKGLSVYESVQDNKLVLKIRVGG